MSEPDPIPEMRTLFLDAIDRALRMSEDLVGLAGATTTVRMESQTMQLEVCVTVKEPVSEAEEDVKPGLGGPGMGPP
jgi:hypothetical protein